MGRFVVRRLAGMVAVLFAISVLVFLIFAVIPNSDPAARIAGRKADKQTIENVRKDFGFDKPIYDQYGIMMKKVFSGELTTYSPEVNVDQQILDGIPATVSLCVGAAIVWMFFGIGFGYFSAVRAGGGTDRALTILALIGISLPVFWLGSMMIYIFSTKLGLFPDGFYVPLTEDPGQWAYHLILPWITLAILFIGFYSRVLRSNMLDVMNEDYVRTARAKGLSERRVRTRHVLRNSLIPIVTLFGLDFGAVVGGGAILTESVFDINGVGKYAADAIGQGDLPAVMAVTLFGAFFIVLFNTLVDIAYAFLDPRIRLGEQAA